MWQGNGAQVLFVNFDTRATCIFIGVPLYSGLLCISFEEIHAQYDYHTQRFLILVVIHGNTRQEYYLYKQL